MHELDFTKVINQTRSPSEKLLAITNSERYIGSQSDRSSNLSGKNKKGRGANHDKLSRNSSGDLVKEMGSKRAS